MSVPHALLALLSEGPKYGLWLREEFEARTGEVWPLNVGQVYRTLQRLERDGLVESDGGEEGPQKRFRITASGQAELAVAALEGLGLAVRASSFPDQLSGGERQRVAIARALVGDRALLLADEPSGALDSVNAEDVMDLLRQACQRGVAAIVVTHDAQLASWADRVMLLRDGRITGQTTQPPGPESLLTPGQGR